MCADYVWIGGTMSDLRSKTKCLDKVPESIKDLPVWNYDGSSTGQAPGTVSLLASCVCMSGIVLLMHVWLPL